MALAKPSLNRLDFSPGQNCITYVSLSDQNLDGLTSGLSANNIFAPKPGKFFEKGKNIIYRGFVDFLFFENSSFPTRAEILIGSL